MNVGIANFSGMIDTLNLNWYAKISQEGKNGKI